MAVVYSLFFLIPSFFSIFYLENKNIKIKKIFIYLLLLTLVLFVGLRANVGVDFPSYLWAFEAAIDKNFFLYAKEHLSNDVVYYSINWFFANLIGPEQLIKTNHYYSGILAVNTVCITILIIGIYLFTKNLENQILAISIFLPYIIFVVSIAYVRQSTSFGFILIAFYFFRNNKIFIAILFSILSLLSHKSSLIFLPLFVLFLNKRSFFYLTLISFPIIIFIILNFSTFKYFVVYTIFPQLYFYQENNIKSSGFSIRFIISLLPAIIYLTFENKLRISSISEKYLWRTISVIIILTGILSFFISTTILDRLLIYFSIIQPFIFSKIPQLFSSNIREKILLSIAIIVFYFSILFVWFNFGKHSYSHLEYKLIILEEPDYSRPFFINKKKY